MYSTLRNLLLMAAIFILCAAAPDSGAEEETPPIPSSGPKLDAANHQLASGDYLLVTFHDGRNRDEFRPQVDADGDINLPLIGSVAIKGLHPNQAAAKIQELYRDYYHDPQVSLQVLDYGRIEVFIFGPDLTGNIHQFHNGTHLLEALRQLKHKEYFSYRRVHVIRGGFDFGLNYRTSYPSMEGSTQNTLALPTPAAVIQAQPSLPEYQNWRPWIEERKQDPESQVWVIDPLQLSVEGELSRYNLLLEEGDALYIPLAERYVDISGVENLGRYELLEEETLGDILRLAGSLDHDADLLNTVIQRYDDHGNLTRVILNIYPGLDDITELDSFKLCNRDVIKIVPREDRVFVLGEVNTGGAFDYEEDSTVLDYIAMAGGETPSAHMSWIAIIRQTRNRLNPTAPQDVIQVNFKEIHKGLPLASDQSLLPGDVIYVPPKGFEFKPAEIFQATGALMTGYAVLKDSTSSSSSSSDSGTDKTAQ